jgi:CRISPR-associated protein Csd2
MGILEQRGRDRKQIKKLTPEEFLSRFWDARLFGSTFLEAEEKTKETEKKTNKQATAA